MMTEVNSMMAVQGIPDWQNALVTEEFSLLPAYEDETLYFLLPRIVRLAERIDKTPDFALEFVSDLNSSVPGNSFYTNINLGLTREGELQGAYELLIKRRPGAALMPASFTTESFWYFEGKAIHESGAFAWESVDRARIYKRIPSELGDLIYGALANGSLSIARAAIGCEIAAFLPRIDSTVSFDPAGLLSAVAGLNPGGSSVPFQQIVHFFANPPAALLEFSGNDSGAPDRNRALTLAGHVRHYLGKSALCPRISDGPHIALLSPPDVALEKPMAWDLRTPLMAIVPLLLDFDPFTPIIQHGGRDLVASFTRVPPLPNDRLTERVVVAVNLPPNILTHEAIELTLQVRKDLSRPGTPTRETRTLYPPAGQPPVIELRFGKSTPKSYSARIRTISKKAEILESPWFECSGDYLYIGTEKLPGICVTIRATSQLLSQARISALIESAPQTEDLSASLSEQQPEATFLLFSINDVARLVVTAQDPIDAGKTLRLDLPCRSVSLDLFVFPQYGPQTVSVTVDFSAGLETAQFEFLPECSDGESIVLEFTPAANTGQWNYNATRLFRNRYRFRRLEANSTSEQEWSDYQSPEKPLTIILY